MSDIIKISKGAKIKAQTDVSKRRVNLADANTITEQMLRDSSVAIAKIKDGAITTDKFADGASGILKSNSYLTSSDFPNTTTLYGWHENTADPTLAWIGGISLTENGSLASSTDHLGTTADCEYDGVNDYLSSNNAAFSFNSNFSIVCWAYRSSWSAPAGHSALISRRTFSGPLYSGWDLKQETDGYLRFRTWNASASSISASTDISKLSAGWHNFAVTVSAAGMTANIYVDGKRAASSINNTIDASGTQYLEIGAIYDAGANGSKWTGRISEVIVHNQTELTENEVRKIYARGARRFAALDQNGSVQIPQNETIDYPERNLIFTSVPTGWTASMAVGLPYRDVMGNWRFRFNFSGTATATAGPIYWTIAGVTWKFGAADRIALAGTSNQYPGGTFAYPGTAQIAMYLSGSYTVFSVSGDIPLLNQPTI